VVDAGGLVHITDTENNRMQTFTDQGQLVSVWASGELGGPGGVALDAAGNFLITEENYNRVSKYGPNRVRITGWGTGGSGPGEFNGPVGIAIDDLGRVIVADHNNGEVDFFGPDGSFLGAISGTFSAPEDVAIGSSGRLYVVDQGNHRIQVFGYLPVATSSSSWGAVKSRYRGERVQDR
jgi:DNA-binding beta-propeller fold protein YncE